MRWVILLDKIFGEDFECQAANNNLYFTQFKIKQHDFVNCLCLDCHFSHHWDKERGLLPHLRSSDFKPKFMRKLKTSEFQIFRWSHRAHIKREDLPSSAISIPAFKQSLFLTASTVLHYCMMLSHEQMEIIFTEQVNQHQKDRINNSATQIQHGSSCNCDMKHSKQRVVTTG